MNVLRRKLFKCGDSYAVIIPREILKENGLTKSKFVYFKLLNAVESQRLEGVMDEQF